MPDTDTETDEAIAQAKGWKFSTKDLGLPDIEDEAGCREFFMLLYTRFGLIWHPDNRFEDYVDLETGETRVFSPRACDLMDGAMARCFEILGDRVYDVALETDEEWRRKGQPHESISCDRCGKPVRTDEIWTDSHENALCKECHDKGDRV